MLELLLWASLAAGSVLPQSSRPPEHPVVLWLHKATEPDVVVALFLPLLGGILLWVRRSAQDKAKLDREEFKDNLLSDLSIVISREMAGLQNQIDLKIEKLSVQIQYISKQSEENDKDINSVEESISRIKDETQKLKVVVHSSYHYNQEFLSRLNSELSTVLSAHLNHPVEIKLFRHHKE